MLNPDLIRWAAAAAILAAAIRCPRPLGFWSLGAAQPIILARIASPTRFRQPARI